MKIGGVKLFGHQKCHEKIFSLTKKNFKFSRQTDSTKKLRNILIKVKLARDFYAPTITIN